MISPDRTTTARSAADKLQAAGAAGAAQRPALVGFDGFIDEIIRVVDRRHSMDPAGYTAIRTIPEFAARAGSAAGKSSNIELVVAEERFGGNGPLMAGAMGRLGAPVTYIGAVGREDNPRALHPLYKELEARCRRVIPIAPPAHTDALEFDDGKIMLGKPHNVQRVTWSALVEAVGEPDLIRIADDCAVIAIVNWVMMAGVEGIWEALCDRVLPRLAPHQRGRRIFIDLCDPAKRTDADVAKAMTLLQRMNALAPVTLGLNLAEAERVARVIGVDAFGGPGNQTFGVAIAHAAAVIRAKLDLACVVVHPREGAGAATTDRSDWFDGPFTATPKLSTGAGDHFNGGFAFAQSLGLDLPECLATGCAVSGAYVRDAASPSLPRLVSFLRELPVPERSGIP
jgi:sugar/nucleoside kinase (ribokinase family)